jgi:hypothetical protein
MAQEVLMATVTGEPFQPVRLHYRLSDQHALLRRFGQLRCVDRDHSQPRWVWLYDHEARKLRFDRCYADLPRQLHPVVIGAFFVRDEGQLLLDLRSCERALLAIPFFDKHIPQNVAGLIEATVVNKLFSADNAELTPDRIFDHQPSTFIDPAAAERRVTELVARVQDPQEKGYASPRRTRCPGQSNRCPKSSDFPSITMKRGSRISQPP